MKHLLLTLTCLLFLIGACKKDDNSSTTSGYSIGSPLVAPTCLVTSVSFSFGKTMVSYDSQKRIVRQSLNQDTFLTVYSYTGNTIIATSSFINEDGYTNSERNTHYLNTNGYIDSTITEGRSSVTVNIYNSQGYRLRELYKTSSGNITSGRSYEYSGGNLIRTYDLTVDWETGTITDSTLSTTYTYYTDKPTKMGDFASWLNRTGKGNKHLVKTEQYDGETYNYTYAWGPNNLPASVTVEGLSIGSASYSYIWKCY
jgi:hypothetical protein